MPPIRRLLQGAIVTALVAASCLAQREPPNLNRTDAQSVLLHQIRWESERAKKLVQMEAFAAQYPKDEAIGWVYEQLYNIYVDEKMVDRALAVGEKLMAMDQEEVELAYKNLKLAEGKKDPVLIKRWAEAAAAAARCVLAAPQKTEIGARRLELAPQVLSYTEYLEYADILRTTNRAKRLDMMAEFLECNPKSIYAPAVRRLSLATWREIDPGKALAIAEKIVEKDQTNEDALIMVAEHYMLRERDLDRVTSYAEKVIALVEQGSRLEGSTDADWAKKKGLLTGRANWLIGSVAMQQNRFSQADRSLRAALPYLRGDSRLTSAALFYLGWANYKIGNVADALRFNQECARSKGPYQDQAAKNLAVIRAENPSHP